MSFFRFLAYILILSSITAIFLGIIELLDNVDSYTPENHDWYSKKALNYIIINAVIIFGCLLNIAYIIYSLLYSIRSQTISKTISETKKEIELLKLQKELKELKK